MSRTTCSINRIIKKLNNISGFDSYVADRVEEIEYFVFCEVDAIEKEIEKYEDDSVNPNIF